MTLRLVNAKPTRPQAEIATDSNLTGLLRRSIQHARKPHEHRIGTLVESEVNEDFVVDVYQTGIRSFYCQTYAIDPTVRGGQRRRERGPQRTQAEALAYGRLRAHKRTCDASRHPKNSLVPTRRTRPPRRYLTTAAVNEAMLPVIEAAAASRELERYRTEDALCPICTKPVSRHGMALHSHLMGHVRRKQITRERKKEIQSQLMHRRGAA